MSSPLGLKPDNTMDRQVVLLIADKKKQRGPGIQNIKFFSENGTVEAPT